MARCTALKSDGSSRCRAFAVGGEDKCLFHSDSEFIKKKKGKTNIKTNEELILILQREMNRAKREIKEPMKRVEEVRKIITLIQELKGEKPLEPKDQDSLQKKIEQWKKKNQTS